MSWNELTRRQQRTVINSEEGRYVAMMASKRQTLFTVV